MAQAAARRNLSTEEYLAFERASEQRHEYANGIHDKRLDNKEPDAWNMQDPISLDRQRGLVGLLCHTKGLDIIGEISGRGDVKEMRWDQRMYET